MSYYTEPAAAPTFATTMGDPMDNTALEAKFAEKVDTEDLTPLLDAKLNVNKILRAYQAADLSINTETLTDTSLGVTVEAGGIYEIEMFIYQNAIDSNYITFAFGGTATITNHIAHWQGFNTITPIDNKIVTDAAAEIEVDAIYGFIAVIKVMGSVEINAAGTFILQTAQTVVSGSSLFKRGSYLVLTKLN